MLLVDCSLGQFKGEKKHDLGRFQNHWDIDLIRYLPENPPEVLQLKKEKNCDFLYIWSWDSVGFVAGWTSEPSVIGHFVSTLLFGGQKKIDTVQVWHDCLAFIFYNLSFAKANIDQHPLHPPFFSQTNNFSHFLNFF